MNEDKNVDMAFYDMLKILYTRTFSLRKFFAKTIFSRKVFPFGLKVRPPEVDLLQTPVTRKNKTKTICKR